MKRFITDHFLLENNTALNLYNDYAKDLPIVDYHCHIESSEIAEDKHYENIAQLWLGGDHYKWRLMRASGIDERYITGDAPDKEKFMMWARAVESAFGNPLYHWTNLELARYFDIDEPLTVLNAEDVWDKTEKTLKSGRLTARSIMKMSNVEAICTTDDPADSLVYHEQIKDSDLTSKVLPAFRPDNIVDIEKSTFTDYLRRLESVSGRNVKSMDDLKEVLVSRLDHFEAHGCRISDHGTEYLWYGRDLKVSADDVLAKRIADPEADLTREELTAYKHDYLRPFDLSTGPLYRFEIVTTEKKTYMLMDVHHLIFDGGSVDIFLSQLCSIMNGEPIEDEDLSYAEYVVAEKAAEGGEEYQSAKDFFKERLSVVEAATEVQPDLKAPVQGTVSVVRSAIDLETIDALSS